VLLETEGFLAGGTGGGYGARFGVGGLVGGEGDYGAVGEAGAFAE
jgi:hypothetical protein